MEEDNHLSKFKLERSIRHPPELPDLVETSYKVISNKPNQKRYPYITFVNNNKKLQVCDLDRYFYIIPTESSSTCKVKVIPIVSKGESSAPDEVRELLDIEEGIFPSQLFPKNLITNVQPKVSKMGRKLYLMICVDSPLFIHRKHDVIKMSIDFKDSPITSVFYDTFAEKDMLSILILTQSCSHICLIDLRSLRILKKVVKEGPRLPIISTFLCESIGTSLYGLDRDGRIYKDAVMVYDPKLVGDQVISKVVKVPGKNIIVVIGYTRSELKVPAKEKHVKGGKDKVQFRDAITLSLLHIQKNNNKVTYSYPDSFVIDHPNFFDLLFSSTFVKSGSNNYLPAVSKTSSALYLFQVVNQGSQYNLEIAHTIKMNSNLLDANKAFDSSIDWKVKIWTLENNAYVTWNHVLVTAWKFNEQSSIKKEKKKWVWDKKKKTKKDTNANEIEADPETTASKSVPVETKSKSKTTTTNKKGGRHSKKNVEEEEIWVKKSEVQKAPKSQKSSAKKSENTEKGSSAKKLENAESESPAKEEDTTTGN